MGLERHLDGYDIYLLDEFESFDIRELVRQCGVMNFKYSPDQWIGDQKNAASSQFIEEMNRESIQKHEHELSFAVPKRQFSLCLTPMLEMKNLYSYILPQIKELLKHSQLFLKESKVVNYLRSIQESEISELEKGEYPAIEALAFAVLELRSYVENQERIALHPAKSAYNNSNILDFGTEKDSRSSVYRSARM